MTEEGRHPEAPRPKPDHDTIDPEEQARKMMGQDEPTEDYTEEERQSIVEDMTEQNQTQTDAQTFEQRVALNYPEDMLKDMTTTRVGVHTWQVLSIRSGEPAVHTVNIKDLTCTCDADTYQDGPCAHIAYVLAVEDGVGLEDLVAQDASYVMKMAETAMGMAEGTTGGTQAEETEDTGETSEGTEDDMPPEETRIAAGLLESAYKEEGIEDMKVRAVGEHVFAKTGRDTQDTIETEVGPDLDVHQWLMQDPNQMKWVHDGSPDWADSPHPLDSEKPGEYFTNAIHRDDVDEYINEVLK